jgi:hypothetical protein
MRSRILGGLLVATGAIFFRRCFDGQDASDFLKLRSSMVRTVE